jgi:type II secretory pathway component GspD/PulD (secretin)
VIALGATAQAGEKDAAIKGTQSPVAAAEKGSATDAGGGQAQKGLSPEQALKTLVKHLDVKDATVEEVISILRQSANFNCAVDLKVGQTKVTMKANNATIEFILNRMAAQGDFRWTIQANSIFVSTAANIAARYAGTVMTPEPAPKQAAPPSANRVSEKLEKHIATFAVSDQPVEGVLNKLSNEAGVRIALDPKSRLRGMGELPRITVELKDTTAKSILDLVANQAALKWAIVGDRVSVLRKSANDKLATPIAEFIVSEEHVDSVLSRLSKESTIEITFDRNLKQEDLRRLQTVTMELRGASAQMILTLITQQAGLKWAVVDERIVVSERTP